LSSHIEATALRALLSQVGGNHELQRRFVHDFVHLWSSRTERLQKALASPFPDAEEAHVVLLAIRSSSTMVGAVTVEATAAMMHDALRDGDIPGSMRHIDRLSEVGEHACHDLAVMFALDR
jgi:HPt (histidine-containing phosphotransfer) domain-containing protein